MQRYFVGGNLNNLSFSENDIFHITKVMRMKENDNIEVVCNEKCYLCKIVSVNPFNVEIIEELKEDRELDVDVTLLYCLPKGEKLDLVVQKATELGVNHIIGVESSRTIVHYDSSKIPSKLERFNKIMKEASEQSHRLVTPSFDDILPFSKAILLEYDYKFIAFEEEYKNENNLLTLFKDVKPNSKVCILVGAEGGFSKEEVNLANKKGFINISLGKRILRSETAAIYALVALSFVRESK
ncbi:MAG: RsmE family RNA methyltransferase [Bacilli bacterium]